MHNTTIHLLSQSAYWRLSKVFVESLGLHKAFLLTNLIDKSEYFTSINQTREGWFFYTQREMLKYCPLAEKTLRDILKEFVALNFIEIELRMEGRERRNYYKVNGDQISTFIANQLIEKSKKNGNNNTVEAQV